MGIPNLFEDEEKTIQTQEWYSILSQSADDYQNCVVKTLTHVKSLRPTFGHEYLLAIIEDVDTGDYTRVIAERQNSRDQIILGSKQPFAMSSSDDLSGDLPLPLYSINFDSNLKVIDLAGILAETSKIGGDYNLITKNCYWFTITAYEALRLKFSGLEEPWYFCNWRGRLILSRNSANVSSKYPGKSLDDVDLCALGKPSELDEERNNKMRWAPGEPVPTWEFLEKVYNSSIRLSAGNSEEADEILEENLTRYIMMDMDRNETVGAMYDAHAPASLSSDLGLDEAYEATNQLSNVSEYKEVYSDYKENERVREHQEYDDEVTLVPEDFRLLEPTEEESEKLDYVIQAMVGRILAEY